MAFNYRAFAAAHEPWAFTDARGRTWTPVQELSALEAIRWATRFEGVRRAELWWGVCSQLIRRLFPFRLQYWWTGDPYRAFREMPLDAQRAAIDDLFRPRRGRTSTPPSSRIPTIPKRSSADSPLIPSPASPVGASSSTRP